MYEWILEILLTLQNTLVALGSWLWLDISGTFGTPTAFVVSVSCTV
jgi:hypothetical protein